MSKLNEYTLLNTQVDRFLNDLLDLDVRLAKVNGKAVMGHEKIRSLRHEYTKAVHDAVYGKTPSRDQAIYDAIVNENCSIQDAADRFGVGRNTVRRAMDRVTALRTNS